MIWKQPLWIVHTIFWIGLGLVVFGSLVNRIPARVCRAGRVEFTSNWVAALGWMVVLTRLAFIGVSYLRHAPGNPLTVVTGGLIEMAVLASLLSVPGTVAVTNEGVEQVFWLRRNTHIRWEEIVEINSGEKDRMVTVIGANGARIVHWRHLADRERFLSELTHHCGETYRRISREHQRLAGRWLGMPIGIGRSNVENWATHQLRPRIGAVFAERRC